MPCTRFALFVDGSNLFGSLKNMQMEVDDYESFYSSVFDEAVKLWRDTTCMPLDCPVQLRRVYWYLVGSMDEWDLAEARSQAAIRERFEDDRDIKRTYMERAGKAFAGAAVGQVADEAWAIFLHETQEWYSRKRDALDGMLRFQHAIQESTDLIDIVPCGHWKVDFLHQSVIEKGLDSRLAVDMVVLAENYDVAILLSGDADSIPSINYLKTKNKHVGAVEFVSGYPPERRGRSFSSRLKLHADFVIRIYEMDLVAREVATKTVPTRKAGDATD